MKKRAGTSRRTRRRNDIPAAAHSRRNRIQAGEFKTVCLHLMDRVRETGEEFVITKRGQPIAKLAPLTDADLRPFVGRSRGVIDASREGLIAPLAED